MKSTKPTPECNRCANQVKARIARKIQRMRIKVLQKHAMGSYPDALLMEVNTFIYTMDDRAAKRPGGIGRQ